MIHFSHLSGPPVRCLLLTSELLDLLTKLLIIPCSLYLSTAHHYHILTCSRSCLISCSSSTVSTPATGKPFLFPSLSMSQYTVLLLSKSLFNTLPTLHSPSPPWTEGEELLCLQCTSMCASVTKAAVSCTADYTARTHNNTLLVYSLSSMMTVLAL